MTPSPRAIDLIVNEETGGEAYYNATEIHPDWPGGASGVTVGIGYDCGYATAETIRADWGPVLPATAVDALASVAGIHGSPASSHAHELRGLVGVTWEAAMAVFNKVDVPKWSALVAGHLPNCDRLSGDSFGALVSLAFNRGPSFDMQGDRYIEMRSIKAHMASGNFSAIPNDIRSMKRLWPNVSDLRNRRDHEATLFQQGLATSALVTNGQQ